jgi:DNA-binding transcriptional LysR family regulator
MPPRAQADLNNVRFFLDAVNAGSFSAAARLYELPPSTVSRRIARLETELGVRLFQRTTRALRLTEAGRAYAGHAGRALAELSAAQQAIGELQESPRGRVRISVPAGMGEGVWASLTPFLRDHRDVRVELDLSDRFVDLVGEGFDLAIRSTRDPGQSLIARRLTSGQRQLFANPQYLEARGYPRTVKALADHDCVLLGHTERATWSLISGAATHKVNVRGRICVNEARMAAQIAASGFGITLLVRSLCEPYLQDGRLVRILPRLTSGETGVWLVYPDRRLAAAARAVAEHLATDLPARFTVH